MARLSGDLLLFLTSDQFPHPALACPTINRLNIKLAPSVALIQAETLALLEWPRLCQHLAGFAATKLGALAADRLRIPADRDTTLTLLAQTCEVYHLESQTASLKFDGIQDIGDALARAELQGILAGEELLDVATTLAGARQLRRIIDGQEDLPVLKALVAALRTYPEIEQEIHRCIDDRGKVADRASPKLQGIREQQRQVRDRILSLLNKLLQRHSNAIQEAIITQRDGRYVIPLKAQQKTTIPGIVHDSSMSGATLYVEPSATVPLNNQLRQMLRQEQAEEEAVRRVLTAQIAAVQDDLERLLAICTTLDLATARARYSLWLEANPPHFIDWVAGPAAAPEAKPEIESEVESAVEPAVESEALELAALELAATPPLQPAAAIVLRQLRHPLLVWQQQHESGCAVVPIDLIIQPQTRVVAITGPNTGGKTVTLKTLGLAVLMAKVGLFVPAREPVELPWFDQVLADIGDEQSLQQSLSTFSGHIRRISRILSAIAPEVGAEIGPEIGPEVELEIEPEEPLFLVDDLMGDQARSTLSNDPTTPLNPGTALVLLDEVGAGTDPTEGSALAIALLKYLAGQAQLTVATTHFGELKALKYDDPRFENASVEFDVQSLSPTYRLLWGIPGRSNALAIAQRLGLNRSVLATAQTYVGGATDQVNQVIAGLEAQRRRQESKAEETAKLLKQAEFFYEQVTAKAAQLKQRETEIKQAQEVAVQAAILDAKAEIAKVIRGLQKSNAPAQEAQQATGALGAIADRYLPSRQTAKPPKPGFRPQVGARVRLTKLGQTAEVLAIQDEGEALVVRFGIMKMTVGLDDIESLQGEKVTRPPQRQAPVPEPVTAPAPLIRTSQNTLDIRGSRVADAEIVIDRAIGAADRALWIIHGHGTGKLRQGVHAFLQQHPRIQGFEAADQNDGGSGVTLVHVLG
jgi:DNA mismatch repair protein MutS2